MKRFQQFLDAIRRESETRCDGPTHSILLRIIENLELTEVIYNFYKANPLLKNMWMKQVSTIVSIQFRAHIHVGPPHRHLVHFVDELALAGSFPDVDVQRWSRLANVLKRDPDILNAVVRFILH